jgi:hypothetical protein
MVPASKWRKDFPDLQLRDVVLMKEDTLAAKDYSLGRVKQVFPGEDGHVRSAAVNTRMPLNKAFE